MGHNFTHEKPHPALEPMASIYKRPDSDIYQCQYYVKSPKTGELSKIRKSTGTTNKKKAQALADQWEAAAQQVIQAGTDRAQQAKEIFAEVEIGRASCRERVLLIV